MRTSCRRLDVKPFVSSMPLLLEFFSFLLLLFSLKAELEVSGTRLRCKGQRPELPVKEQRPQLSVRTPRAIKVNSNKLVNASPVRIIRGNEDNAVLEVSNDGQMAYERTTG